MPKIFINPGHSPDFNNGGDPGAVSPRTGLKEAEVALKVGTLVKQYLEAVGYEVYLLQSDSLGYICDESNNWDSDYFVSIHCNAAANYSAKGCETWIYSGSVKGRRLADSIQEEIIKNIPIVDRGIKVSNGLYVLKNTNMPSVLVELGFVTSEVDEQLLSDSHYQDEYARCIARGISNMYV
jgi:N-acetylmuramoyl-L-alanine amidase